MEVVKVNNITKSYGSQHVLQDVSFSLTSGNCISLIGPNGAGKTTMLRILTGLIKPSSGQCIFNDEAKDRRLLIGYLPQYPVFHNWMTGEEFLIYSAKLTGIPGPEAKKRTKALLNRVGILHAKDKHIQTYSGGMKQRLGIAQAIIHRPALLVLDEPVSALDPIGRREVLDLLETLKQEMTILFSTHILSDADEVSDDVILLHDGKVVEADSIEQLRRKYQTAKIELTFDGNSLEYEQPLAELETVLQIKEIRNTLHLTVTNIEAARDDILANVQQYGWPLTSFIINRASLEDMFMKAVEA